jgi:cytochrome c oxidase cbb3-type subunit II
MSLWRHHKKFETNTLLLLVGVVVTIAIGGLVEIVPLFTIGETIERVEGVRPYSPLELAGRNIYLREGCYNCHSQQIRPFRDEVERYGHFSLAAESMFDHPFQWGSKRTGPDLGRIGGKYSNDWHVAHLIEPKAVVRGTVMPPYPFLAGRLLDDRDIAAHLIALRKVGVPYTDAMVANARTDLHAQTQPDGDTDGLLKRYPKAVVANFDGAPGAPTEMDALVAYLQMLGTLVDLTTFKPQYAQTATGGAR